MTAAVANRRMLSDGIVTLLAASGLKVGLVRTPEDVVIGADGLLTSPYAILYPADGFTYEGDYALPQRQVRLPHQLTSVGRTAEQAAWAADTLRQRLLERNPGGDFKNPITASDVQVIDRYCSMQGGPEMAGGGLWQVVDRYELEVVSV